MTPSRPAKRPTGVFDPQPTGEAADRRALTPQALEAGERRLTWLSERAVGDTFTVRMTAGWAEGEQDVGYGVVVGAEDDLLAVAVSPLGYATVWVERTGWREMVFPWQPWPHVRRGSEANELQIEVSGGHASVRVNRERLWEGETDIQGASAGLYAQSFGEESIIEFQELVTFLPAVAITPASGSP